MGVVTLVNDLTAETRLKYGVWVILAGFGVAFFAVLAAIWKMTDATSIAGVVASLTGMVGTVIGAFFGFHAGASGREQAEAERNDAVDKLTKMAAVAPEDKAASILGL
jgi:hypothetical protein